MYLVAPGRFIHYELLKAKETINGELNRPQLMQMSRALRKKRPQCKQIHNMFNLQYDNAWNHIASLLKHI